MRRCAGCRRDGSRRPFAADEAGVTSVIFAIMFSVFFLVAALAVDWGIGTTEKLRQQEALDAATLAASEKLGLPEQDTEGPAVAHAFFAANTGNDPRKTIDSIEFDEEAGEIVAATSSTLLTHLLKAVGIEYMTPSSRSTVAKAVGTVEVVLVLDNSGSMAGQWLTDLKAAASTLLNVAMTGSRGTDRVRVGVVPFAASVNVGAWNATSGWIDTAGLAPSHYENFEGPTSRLDLFSAMSVPWGGCVEARPSPHDVEDTAPTAMDGATLFVPMFAPDEPDDANDGDSSRTVDYPNNYLGDGLGSCPDTRVCTRTSRRGTCTRWAPGPALSPETAQARVCKYDLETPDSSAPGPNQGCTTTPIRPLTSTRDDIEASIDAMVARGNTNIAEALMWGVRVLSPDEPFTEGRAYDTQGNEKFLVLMTDGENNLGAGYSNQNRSIYTPYGYASKGRLGTTYTQTGYRNVLNAKTAATCATAKAHGIKVYTIAFRLESNPTTLELLRNCASTAEAAFKATDGAGLSTAFRAIARDITKLRVAG